MQNENILIRSPELLKKKYAEYLAPTLFMNISLAITSVVNTAIVGNLLGSKALAAVNLCMPAFSLGNVIINTIVIGACTLIVACKGEMNQRKADRIFTQLVIFSLVIMSLLGLAIALLDNPLSTIFMGGVNNPEMKTLVLEYLFPLSFSFPAIAISLGGAMILRTDGHPRFSAGVILTAGIVNLATDFLFISVFQWGVAGAAWATVAGFTCASFLVLPYFWGRSRTLHFCSLGKNIFQGFGNALLTGLPSGVTNLLMFARILLLNMLIFRIYNSGGAAAFAVCLNTQYLVNMFLLGITQAMQPLSAMLFSEKDYFGLKSLFHIVITAVLTIATLFAGIFILTPGMVGHLFGLEEEGLKMLPSALTALAIALPFFAFNSFYISYCQTIRRIYLGLTISFMSCLGFILLLVPFFYFVFPHYFWYILSTAECLAFLSLLVIIKRIGLREGCSPLLVRAEPKQMPMLDLSIHQIETDAVSLSEQAIQFCLAQGIDSKRANAAGVIVEETAVNIIHYSNLKVHSSKKKIILDIVLRIDNNEVIGRFRDAGIAWNPLDVKDPPPDSGLGLIKGLAKDAQYVRTLGFNIFLFRI